MWVAYNSIKRKTVYRWHEYCLRLPSDYALYLPWVELAGWISCFKPSASVLVFEPPLFPNYLDFWYLLLREVASVIELVQIDRRTKTDIIQQIVCTFRNVFNSRWLESPKENEYIKVLPFSLCPSSLPSLPFPY